MKKDDATKILNQLNKVINGSNKIIATIDDKNLNNRIDILKTLRASFLNNTILAEQMKILTVYFVENTKEDPMNIFNDMFRK